MYMYCHVLSDNDGGRRKGEEGCNFMEVGGREGRDKIEGNTGKMEEVDSIFFCKDH